MLKKKIAAYPPGGDVLVFSFIFTRYMCGARQKRVDGKAPFSQMKGSFLWEGESLRRIEKGNRPVFNVTLFP